MTRLVVRFLSLTVVLLVLPAEAALACSSQSSGTPLNINSNPFPGLQPPPAGRTQGVIGIQVGLFAPAVPTTCVCGLGVGKTGVPAPASLTVDQAVLTRYNPATGQHTILTEFVPLTLSGVTTAGLTNGPGQLLPGSRWFGFSGQIQPFTIPMLGPGEIFTLSFAYSFAPSALSKLNDLPIQFAAGAGQFDGTPDFDPRSEHPVQYFDAGMLPPCLRTNTALCLNNGRFRVNIDWRTATNSGKGGVAGCPLKDSGNFYFFDPGNLEMLVKVLNACSFNNRYWVFYSAGTNVEFTLTVTDTKIPRIKQYMNPLGKPAPPVQDTSAFATCPYPPSSPLPVLGGRLPPGQSLSGGRSGGRGKLQVPGVSRRLSRSCQMPRPLVETQIGPVGGKKVELTVVTACDPWIRLQVLPPSVERITPFCIVPTRMWQESEGSHAITVASDRSPSVKRKRPLSVTACVS
jgi:hypothetical protein